MKKKKSIWIDDETIADIEKEVKERGAKFAAIANERMKHRVIEANEATPYIRAKTQTIINLCRVGKFDKAQEEENKLWNF